MEVEDGIEVRVGAAEELGSAVRQGGPLAQPHPEQRDKKEEHLLGKWRMSFDGFIDLIKISEEHE